MKLPVLLIAISALALGAASVQASAQSTDAATPDYSAVRLSDVDYSHSAPAEGKVCCGTLTALGKATNTSAHTLEHPVFEARFFDAGGKLVDAFNEASFGLSLQPGQSVMVRIQDRARYEASHYARAEISLVSGEFAPPEQYLHVIAKADHSIWVKLLTSLLPVILLIGLLMWMGRRSASFYPKELLQYQKELVDYEKAQLNCAQEQNQLLARQAAALERLADHAPARDARSAQT